MVKEKSIIEMNLGDDVGKMLTPTGEPIIILLYPTPVPDAKGGNTKSVSIFPSLMVDHADVERRKEESKKHMGSRKLKGKSITLEPEEQCLSVNNTMRKINVDALQSSKLKLKREVKSLKKCMMESDFKIFNIIEVLIKKVDKHNALEHQDEEYRCRGLNIDHDNEYHDNNVNHDQNVTIHLDNIQTMNEDPTNRANDNMKLTKNDGLFDLKIKALYKNFIENNGDSDVVKMKHDISKYILGEWLLCECGCCSQGGVIILSSAKYNSIGEASFVPLLLVTVSRICLKNHFHDASFSESTTAKANGNILPD
ncbi:hypothetical protein BC332_28336 [Capsicum chinense]|nr:hypothetical protein BC332_28336 [Capsicum chinense]